LENTIRHLYFSKILQKNAKERRVKQIKECVLPQKKVLLLQGGTPSMATWPNELTIIILTKSLSSS